MPQWAATLLDEGRCDSWREIDVAAKKPKQTQRDSVGIDWIVLTASAIALSVVVVASAQAGERGLLASIANFVISTDA